MAGEISTVVEGSLAFMPVMSTQQALERRQALVDFYKRLLTPAVDYGKIPGSDKPTLLKPGAEKLCTLFGLSVGEPDFIERTEDWTGKDHAGEPFFYYLIRQNLYRNGNLVASQVGSANSWEKKYRYRSRDRVCPHCNKPCIIKGKEEYGGGFICFAKKGGCGTKYRDNDPLITEQQTGQVANPDIADIVNCVTPDTRILTRDLRWVPAGEISNGMELIGVSENKPDQWGRRLEISSAIVYGRSVDSLYELEFEDGRKVKCNGEHKWLVKKVGSKEKEWVETASIFKEQSKSIGRPRNWRIMSLVKPWEIDNSNRAGYLAGLFDADGCIGVSQKGFHAIGVHFAQQHNGVLSLMEEGLKSLGFRYGIVSHGNKVMKQPVAQLSVHGGLPELMRILGMLRPPRLLLGWLTKVHLDRRRLESDGVLLTGIRSIGDGEIVRMGTTSRTYIAEGFVAHNTLQKMAQKRALVAAVLLAVNASEFFTQDIEDVLAPHVDQPTPPDPFAGRPSEEGMDDTEIINEEQLEYLCDQAKRKGYHDARSLISWVDKHCNGLKLEKLGDMPLYSYRKMLESMKTWKKQAPKAKA